MAVIFKLIKALIISVSIFSILSLLTLKFSNFCELEIIANFQAYYFLVHLAALPLLLIYRKRISLKYKLLLVIQIFFVINTGRVILPFYFFNHNNLHIPGGSKKLSVYYANINSSNDNIELISNQIKEYNPDLTGLLETNQKWSSGLNLKGKYPHHFEVLREDNFGLSVYSRYPLEGQTVTDFGEGLQPAYYGSINAEGKKVNFALLHLLPPVSSEALYRNRLLLRRLSTLIRFREEPFVLMGDFNATPFSTFYRKFIEWTSLNNVFFGGGFYSTWNAKIPLLRINIDHVLYSNINLEKAEILPFTGSDHYPILSIFNY